MNNRISVPTIDNIEFINLQENEISPLVQKGQVKVFYIGQNRNGSSIDKETGTKMSKTLRGCPIVGWYKEDKEDFGDHGEQMTINGDGVTFEKLTKPYGFIPTDAKIWWQFFEDKDEWGNAVVREYLVAECLLWAGQFPECKEVIENHNPQSMELDPESLKGHWATDNNSGLEFFIINDAIFSTLCILGEDVEPCFEGASFEEPKIDSTFSKDSSLVKEMFTMMQEIRYALNNDKGGLSMDPKETPVVEQDATSTEQVLENSLSDQDKNSELNTVQNETNIEDFAKNDDDDKDKKNQSGSDEEGSEEEEEEKKKPNAKNSLNNEEFEKLQTQLNELQEKYTLLEQENSSLLAFKAEVENKQKDELIDSFYMLSDEDKKDIIANKANYSLEDIKKELSVICFDKKVNFSTEEKKKQQEEKTTPTVFNLNSHQADELPAWLKAVEEVQNRNN